MGFRYPEIVSSDYHYHIADNNRILVRLEVGPQHGTVLLCVYNNIINMDGKGNGSYLVLLEYPGHLTHLALIFDLLYSKIYWNNW